MESEVTGDFLPKISENYNALKNLHEAAHSFEVGGKPILLVSTEDIKDQELRMDLFCKDSILQVSEEWADIFYLREITDIKKVNLGLVEMPNSFHANQESKKH